MAWRSGSGWPRRPPIQRQSLSLVEGGTVLEVRRRRAFLLDHPGTSYAVVHRRAYLVADNFLPVHAVDVLTEFALANERHFARSGVSSPGTKSGVALEFRRSVVLYGLGPYRAFFLWALGRVIPQVFAGLGIRPFAVRAIDVQVTATNDGEFFRPHTDNGDARARGRTVSYVLFIHREPKAFEGGELRLYPFARPDGREWAIGPSEAIEPRRNRIVFFGSGSLHEVAPVRCRSRAFRDGRLTVNGWIL